MSDRVSECAVEFDGLAQFNSYRPRHSPGFNGLTGSAARFRLTDSPDDAVRGVEK